jgi:tetratricopeptide (TPR) repeat protein
MSPGYALYRDSLNFASWMLAMVRIRLGAHAGAAAALEEAVHALPERAHAYRQVISFMVECVDLARADPSLSEEEREAAAERYIELERELVGSALEHLREAKELDVLAWSLVTTARCLPTPHHPDLAVQLAERAVSLEPDRDGYHGTLGAALCTAERWEEAERTLLTAIRLAEGGTGFDLLCLAIARAHLGRKEEARRAYEQALEWMRQRPPDTELRRYFGENVTNHLANLKALADKALRGE